MKKSLLGYLAVLLAVAGCDCGSDGGTSGSQGLPELDRVAVDFGRVRIGESKRADVTIVNRGRVTLKLNGFDRAETPAVFRIGEPPPDLAPNATTTVSVIFAPEAKGVVGGKVVLLTDSAERPRVEISLGGEGVETMVRITPETVDFGVVEVDGRENRTITLTNEGTIVEDVAVRTLADGSDHFSGGPIPGGGSSIRLEPGSTVELPVSFAPRYPDKSGFVSSATFLPCPTCSTVTVTLRGIGVDSFLALDPAPPKCLEFGLVNPGSSRTLNATFKNLGSRDVTLATGEITTGAGKFTIGQTFPAVVNGESELVVPVTYAPDALTNDAGTMTVTSDDPKAPRVELCLRGTGGGPDISVTPVSLNFGQVAVGAARTRTVRVMNVGSTTPGVTETPLLVSAATVRTGATTGLGVEFAPVSLKVGESTLVTVSFDPKGDGQVTDVLEFASNDSDTPVAEVALAGHGRALAACNLEVLPSSGTLAFGNVDRNRRASLPFALRNVGTDDCLLDSMALSATTHDAFTLQGAPPAQVTLQPGEVFTASVEFAPLVFASYSGQVTYVVNDPAQPTRTLELSGVATPGCLLISPDTIEFGVTGALCQSFQRTVNIYNVCQNDIQVKAISLAADPSGAYILTPSAIPLPHTLTGSTSLSVKVEYYPQTLGVHPGGVFIETDERPEPYLVSLSGRAEPDPTQVDRFSQDRRPIDILFVIDDSGSMGDEQQSLADNLDRFMAYANSAQIDYRIAVTTTDTDSSAGAKGRFVPLASSGTWPTGSATPPRVLRPNTPEVLRAFATNVNVGTTGSATEMGFEATRLALSPQLLGTHNSGFLRDDAALSVIAVTDEKEQSPMDLNFYYSYFLSIKGTRRANLFSFSAICELDAVGESYGGAYVEMAKRTGGIYSSIRTSNWAADLEKLGLTAFGYKSRFLLTSIPDETTIVVKINGREVPKEDVESQNWSYDPVTNLVEFSPHAIPEPGQSLEVSYTVRCTQ